MLAVVGEERKGGNFGKGDGRGREDLEIESKSQTTECGWTTKDSGLENLARKTGTVTTWDRLNADLIHWQPESAAAWAGKGKWARGIKKGEGGQEGKREATQRKHED